MEHYVKKETVSIIIPAYNAEEYLEKCIKSILSQPYPLLEVIVVNDGSTDRTQQIAQNISAQDSRIKLINTQNGGVSAARNIGLTQASGEYIMFVDADDVLLNGALPYMIDLQKEHGADIVSATAISALPDQEYEDHFIAASETKVLKDSEPLKQALLDLPAAYSACAKLYTRNAIKDIVFPLGKRVHEDSFFLFKCFLNKITMVITDAIVYKITLTPNSASRSPFSEKFFDMLDLLEIKLQDIKEQYPEYKELSYNMVVKTHLTLLENLCKSTDKKNKKAEKESIRQVIKYRQYFRPASSFNKKLFFIVRYHLFGLYKAFYQLKNR